MKFFAGWREFLYEECSQYWKETCSVCYCDCDPINNFADSSINPDRFKNVIDHKKIIIMDGIIPN